MKVMASPGLKCPQENKPRAYITDDPSGVDVEATAYYRRLVDDGSLVEIKAGQKTAGKGGDQ